MSRRTTRITDASAFVLHSTPWRETSLILKAFSREHGIVTLVAKGAKRPYSGLRSVLMVFQPLSLSWSGAAEVKTLTQAEVVSIIPMPGSVLMSGWYMNELLIKLLALEDPHPVLFDAYAQAISQLAELGHLARGRATAAVLRQFDWVSCRRSWLWLKVVRSNPLRSANTRCQRLPMCSPLWVLAKSQVVRFWWTREPAKA